MSESNPMDRAHRLAALTGRNAIAIREWGVVERVSTGLLSTKIGLQPVTRQMLQAADQRDVQPTVRETFNASLHAGREPPARTFPCCAARDAALSLWRTSQGRQTGGPPATSRLGSAPTRER